MDRNCLAGVTRLRFVLVAGFCSRHECTRARLRSKMESVICEGAIKERNVVCVVLGKNMQRKAFTILELLIVVTIIAILFALFFPAVQAARERARAFTCMNNVYQLNVATCNFVDTHQKLPSHRREGTVGGWTVEILAFLDKRNLRNNLTIGTNIAEVDSLLLASPMMYRCPTRSSREIVPDNTMFPSHYVLVPDKDRETFLMFEAPIDLSIPWANGPEMDYMAVRKSQGPHHGGLHFVNGPRQAVELMFNGETQRQ